MYSTGNKDYRVFMSVYFPYRILKKQSQKMFPPKNPMVSHELFSYKHTFQT